MRKISVIIAFCLFFTACKDEPEMQQPKPEGDVFYIVGYKIDKRSGYSWIERVVDTANGIGKAGVYLLVPEYFKGSYYDILFTKYVVGEPLPQIPDSTYEILKNAVWNDALYSGNLPDTLFDFPSTIVYPIDPCRNSGVNIFPEEYRWKYKVRMTHRPMTMEERYFYYEDLFYPVGCSRLSIYPFFHLYLFQEIEQNILIFTESISREED